MSGAAKNARAPGLRRVLVIDDNPAIHADFHKVLSLDPSIEAQAELHAAEAILLGEAPRCVERPSFEIGYAQQGRDGVSMVQQALGASRPFAMAFVDMRMPPGWDGLETIERLWAVDPHLQIVICSAHSDYDWADVVQRLGHSDQVLVLRKPFEPIEVLQCANAMTRKWQNESAMRRQLASLEQAVSRHTEGLEAANRQLRHLATHDVLTGLPNRVLIEDRVSHALAHANRDGQSFALLLCDLDRFKLINESLGHRAGDQLLQEVARRLTAAVRNIDTVARRGGDEFVLVLNPVADRAEAIAVAGRLIDALRAPVEIAGIGIHASPSVGIVMCPEDADTLEAAFARADAAIFAAKQRGRNGVQCYEAGMDMGASDKVRFESELHEALARQQFELHYQPKVDMQSSAVHSAEALVRWRHPDRGLISPAEFIPIAEECGLIGAIGEWVVREACRQGRAWQTGGLPSLRIAVNLSAAQFRAGSVVDTIRRALADSAFEARFLEVELTESAVMSDAEESVRTLEQLSEMGILVSVDDFGTGYSSMSHLRRLPIDKLKIDRSFISEITARADDASIVQAIVSLAHSLRLKVVAEGVETAEQLEFLRDLACDQYQGYYFSRPLPAPAFEALLRSDRARRGEFTQADTMRTHSKLAAYRRK